MIANEFGEARGEHAEPGAVVALARRQQLIAKLQDLAMLRFELGHQTGTTARLRIGREQDVILLGDVMLQRSANLVGAAGDCFAQLGIGGGSEGANS